jgi:hypothetical protein
MGSTDFDQLGILITIIPESPSRSPGITDYHRPESAEGGFGSPKETILELFSRILSQPQDGLPEPVTGLLPRAPILAYGVGARRLGQSEILV